MNQLNVTSPLVRKPNSIMVIPGTCGGCKSFELQPNQKELAGVPCANKASDHFGEKVGMLGINGCTKYVAKTSVPEGFNLI